MEKRISVFEELKRQREEKEHYKKQASEWQNKFYKIEAELKKVKALLNQFLNSNTPSSQLPPQFKQSFNERPEKGTNPRGKPQGSNGATKEPPSKIDRKAKVEIHKNCKKCGRSLKIEKYTRIIYEIPKIKVTATEFEIEEGYCKHCDLLYIGTHPELPHEGMMGPNLQAFFTELKHNFAGSYDRISTFFGSLTDVSFSHTAINDCVGRVASQLGPSYKSFEEKLEETDHANSDETSWPVGGEAWWLWLFATANFVFITIQNSRARKVLTNLFGGLYNGVMVSDCFRVYEKIAVAFQKDWVHLLRKTHFEADKHSTRNIVKLHDELSNMYYDVLSFCESNPTFEQRVWQSITYHQKLQRIANCRWSNPAKSIVDGWLKRYEGQWMVPVIMSSVPLTNNVAERGIRKVIPSRKLLGGHRTEKGARDFAIIETHRQTWKLRNQSPYNMLVDYLKKCNAKPAA